MYGELIEVPRSRAGIGGILRFPFAGPGPEWDPEVHRQQHLLSLSHWTSLLTSDRSLYDLAMQNLDIFGLGIATHRGDGHEPTQTSTYPRTVVKRLFPSWPREGTSLDSRSVAWGVRTKKERVTPADLCSAPKPIPPYASLRVAATSLVRHWFTIQSYIRLQIRLSAFAITRYHRDAPEPGFTQTREHITATRALKTVRPGSGCGGAVGAPASSGLEYLFSALVWISLSCIDAPRLKDSITLGDGRGTKVNDEMRCVGNIFSRASKRVCKESLVAVANQGLLAHRNKALLVATARMPESALTVEDGYRFGLATNTGVRAVWGSH
ncbi:hypothetical protein BD779DRAFT_1693994 [Infundibulicybe gibba]|nr:hypothetical protein BD779DRAFT_1693994 [Infundibulicybe gibba]